MTRKQPVETATPCDDVEIAREMQCAANVIVGIDAIELRQQPKPLLRKGQFQWPIARDRRNRGGSIPVGISATIPGQRQELSHLRGIQIPQIRL